MARITLDFVNYQDDDGNFNGQIIHDMTRGLNITFDEIGEITIDKDAILCEIIIEFTGPYEDLIALIDRYEEDPSLRPGLITDITNIHN